MSKIPSKEEILAWIVQNPSLTAKRDIAKAFGIKGAARIDLKHVLKELENAGHLAKRKKSYRDPDRLPPVAVLKVTGPDPQGDLFAQPVEWHGHGDIPHVLIVSRKSDPALGPGDRVLCRMTLVQAQDHSYEARLIRRIGTNPHKILGIFRKGGEGGRIVPIDKAHDKVWLVRADGVNDAQDGELVEGEQSGPKDRAGLPRARVIQRLGNPSAPRAVSLIAIHQHDIPDTFSDATIAEADAATPALLGQREDLRHLPFVTIDPADARDHDDACYAHPDEDPENPGGHIIWVAIADVAHYVRPGSELDNEARKRGNSTYFPDRVVPMLPDRLSGDLCSLHEGVPRPVIAVRMVLDAQGEKINQRFTRGFIISTASLHYEEVQAAQDGAPNAKCAPLMANVIKPLYSAYHALRLARARRQPLDLDLPERQIVLSKSGKVTSVAHKDRLDAHRLIEEFMVLANVAAAQELRKRRQALLYRVHEEPNPEKLEALRETATACGLSLAKGQVLQTRHLNGLLSAARDKDFAETVNMATLRAMTQAYYYPENFGHFGLALREYAHFTSPIRRYADLIVHRALIAGHGWGRDGLTTGDMAELTKTAEHISQTERRSMSAERDTNDRYLAAFLAERVGAQLTGRVSGVQKFGAFVRLDETGADGLIPVRSLGREFFHYDAQSQTLMGQDTGLTLAMGQRVQVKLAEATPATGGLILELIEVDGQRPAPGGHRRGKPGVHRKAARHKTKTAKTARKVSRNKLSKTRR